MKVYTLEVSIFEGLIDEAFIKKNPVISRIIEILGNQNLEQLHKTIFHAFNRKEEHLYAFQMGNDPYNPDKRYVLKIEEGDGFVETTTIDDLDLKQDDIFGYLFDYGDSWLHQVTVISIEEKKEGKEKYPRVTKKIGKSPPQYPK
jgi:hypothetical protein